VSSLEQTGLAPPCEMMGSPNLEVPPSLSNHYPVTHIDVSGWDVSLTSGTRVTPWLGAAQILVTQSAVRLLLHETEHESPRQVELLGEQAVQRG
jgi:hypothetical protein